jgi:hypothetical protein
VPALQPTRPVAADHTRSASTSETSGGR